jgi:putative oxidoreductase
MNVPNKISAWGDRHHPKILDIIRMILGAFLVFKGVIFFNNAGYLRDLILEKEAINQPPGVITAIIYYVTYIHILGGGLIFVGLYTRLWALLNLPIVFGAVFLVNITAPFVHSELWLSILVLALLCLFIFIGSGPLSLDRILLKSNTFGEE